MNKKEQSIILNVNGLNSPLKRQRLPGCRKVLGQIIVLDHASLPPLQSLETALKYCNYMFTTVFVLEAVLKLVAFGLRRFFKDR